MSKCKIISNVTIVLLFVIILVGCNNNVSLSLNAKKGDSYKCSIEVDNEVKNYKTDVAKQKNTYIFNVNVKDVDNEGNHTLDFKYESVKLEYNNIIIDTDNKGKDKKEEELVKPYKNLIGKGFSVKINKYGKVVEFLNLDEITQPVPDIDGNITNVKANKKNLEEIYGLLLQQCIISFSDESLSSDGIWYMDKSMMSLMRSGSELTKKNAYIGFKLDKSDGDYEVIKIDDLFKVDADYMSINGELQSEDDATIKGTINVNKKNGLESNGELEQDYRGNFKFKDESDVETIEPIEFISKIKYSFEKK